MANSKFNAGDKVAIVGEKGVFTIGEAIGFSNRLNAYTYIVRFESGSCIRNFPEYNIIGLVA